MISRGIVWIVIEGKKIEDCLMQTRHYYDCKEHDHDNVEMIMIGNKKDCDWLMKVTADGRLLTFKVLNF